MPTPKTVPALPESLARRKALVTGASSGIGAAIAKVLAEKGASVALLARDRNRLAQVASHCEDHTETAIPISVDLTETNSTDLAVTQAADELGGLDLLVNAAGVAYQSKLSDGNPEEWRSMLDLNVFGLAYVTRQSLAHFPDEGGDIVNLGSMSGHRVPGKGGFYSATKFAVRAMTEGLRQELRAKGNLTRVSSVSPGFVDTALLDTYFRTEGRADNYEAIGYPILSPEDIASVVIRQLTLPRTAEVTDVLLRPTQQVT
ncbi:MAG: SDR family oxidoreductase [Verrucomicrobiota bacterium]